MAVQEGLVDLDTPVSEYLPDFRVHSRYDEHPEDVMTLRHMLSHWAGFTHDPPAGLNLDQPDYFERYIETISVVVLTNRESHGLTGLEGRQIVNGPIINRYGPLPTADPELEKMQKVNIQDPRVKSILGRYGDSPGLVVGIENGVLGLRLNDTSFTAMTIYDDGGELVGFYGSTREVRLLPSRGKQPGSMMLVSRTHSNSNSHYCRSRRLTFPRMDGFKVL